MASIIAERKPKEIGRPWAKCCIWLYHHQGGPGRGWGMHSKLPYLPGTCIGQRVPFLYCKTVLLDSRKYLFWEGFDHTVILGKIIFKNKLRKHENGQRWRHQSHFRRFRHGILKYLCTDSKIYHIIFIFFKIFYRGSQYESKRPPWGTFSATAGVLG